MEIILVKAATDAFKYSPEAMVKHKEKLNEINKKIVECDFTKYAVNPGNKRV